MSYMSRLHHAHAKPAKELLYLETGKIPPRFLIIQRRLMFLKHILSTNKNGLIFKFYNAQKAFPVKNDWVKKIEVDKNVINLHLSDNQIALMSKNKFKKMLKSHISSAALIYLDNLAKEHSKSTPLRKRKLKCAKYLKDVRFSISETQLLFQLRTRMFTVKSNFKNKYKLDQSCELCKRPGVK